MGAVFKTKGEFAAPRNISGLHLFFFLILGIILSFLISYSLALGLVSSFLILVIISLAGFGFKNFLLLLILLRICVDAFHQELHLPLIQFKSLSVPGLLGILILVLGFFYILLKKVDFWRHPLVKPFGFFLLGCILSLPFSQNLTTSLLELVELLSFIVLFILIVDSLESERDIKRLVSFVVFSSIIPLLVGLFQILSNFNLAHFALEPDFRVSSTLTHPNAYAFYLVMVTVLSVSLFLQEKSQGMKTALFFLIGLLVVSLIFTYTRSAWIGLVFAVFLLGILKRRKLFFIFAPLAIYGIISVFPFVLQLIFTLFPEFNYQPAGVGGVIEFHCVVHFNSR